MSQDFELAAKYLLSATKYRPEVGIICGSGLSGLSKNLTEAQTVKYSDIPGFPRATVAGHKGEMVFGMTGNTQCVCMKGRFHFYEGNSMDKVIMPVRVMRLLGVKLLIVTNAAGGLNPDFNVGDIMVIQDHFGLPPLAGNHPLRGENNDQLGPRFPAMSDAYDENLQKIVLDAAKGLNLDYKVRPNGTYCFVSGPSYETRAECHFLRSIGGDSVGMSTVPEVIAAKHCGMKVLGLSLITNKVVTSKEETNHASHAEVLEAVEGSGKHVEAIVKTIISGSSIENYLKALPEFSYKFSEKTSNKNCQCTDCQCIDCTCTGGKCECAKCCCSSGKTLSSSSCCCSPCKCSPCTCSPCKCSSPKCHMDSHCWITLAGVSALILGIFVVVKHRHFM